MTLIRDPDSPRSVRLVECPFCGADLRHVKPSKHLEECVEFYRQNGVEVPTWLRFEHVADLEAADG